MSRDREFDPRELIRNLPRPAFELGEIVATPGALMKLTLEEILTGLSRHQAGDWGDLDEEDRAANDQSLRDGSRLLSAFTSEGGRRFWIITEWDRSVTTVLLPEEY